MSEPQTAPTAREPPVIGIIHAIPTVDIYPMPENPFAIRHDDSMTELVNSVKQFGILMPAEVRPREDGGYEMISGTRRKYAAEQAGIDTIPAIILDADYDDALIRMVDSNIQRENLLPSERAQAYKIRIEAMKRKAGRPAKDAEKNAPKISAHFRSDDAVGAFAGVSGDTIRNYISLTNLIPELMQMVDSGDMAVSPAYHIATLSQEEQALLVDTISSEQNKPSVSQAQKLERLSKAGKLNEDTMLEIMMQPKKPVKNDITLSGDKLRKYFPKSYSPIQMEAVIFKLLEAWHQKRQRSQSR